MIIERGVRGASQFVEHIKGAHIGIKEHGTLECTFIGLMEVKCAWCESDERGAKQFVEHIVKTHHLQDSFTLHRSQSRLYREQPMWLNKWGGGRGHHHCHRNHHLIHWHHGHRCL